MPEKIRPNNCYSFENDHTIFLEKLLEGISSFCGATADTRFGVLVTSAMGFQSKNDYS